MLCPPVAAYIQYCALKMWSPFVVFGEILATGLRAALTIFWEFVASLANILFKIYPTRRYINAKVCASQVLVQLVSLIFCQKL